MRGVITMRGGGGGGRLFWQIALTKIELAIAYFSAPFIKRFERPCSRFPYTIRLCCSQRILFIWSLLFSSFSSIYLLLYNDKNKNNNNNNNIKKKKKKK
jgi:hypothetical protein